MSVPTLNVQKQTRNVTPRTYLPVGGSRIPLKGLRGLRFDQLLPRLLGSYLPASPTYLPVPPSYLKVARSSPLHEVPRVSGYIPASPLFHQVELCSTPPAHLRVWGGREGIPPFWLD